MCGDHPLPATGQSQPVGSPPHVRGPHLLPSVIIKAEGITPACAGTTAKIDKPAEIIGDHPRMCGDHKLFKSTGYERVGSPPHVRGPRISGYYYVVATGITPACAGTTLINRV